MAEADVLAAREIVHPFTLPVCSPISDGAAAALLVSADFPAGLRADPTPPVKVLASVVRSAPADGSSPVSTVAGAAAYEMAGVGPGDLHCVEVHDAAASAELTICEQLGLGEGPALARSGDTEIGRRIPARQLSGR